jgi:PadR family transcriptional regulator, regulatory protein AphA
MSLRYALLGLLSEHPQSGWDLSRKFSDTLGAVWPAGQVQIHGELRRRYADELLSVRRPALGDEPSAR